jgi:hypothetical protein
VFRNYSNIIMDYFIDDVIMFSMFVFIRLTV